MAASQEASLPAAPDNALADEGPDDEWCTLHGLLDTETCSSVAKHCNETKQAAKVVQVCRMKNTPAGAHAHNLPGLLVKPEKQRSVDLHTPVLALELRRELQRMGVACQLMCHFTDPRRFAQETSMRLFLCALLARRPMVAQGIVTSLNGQRFFHLYVPELGLELRIESEEIQPAPMVTDWNKDGRCALPLMSILGLCSRGRPQSHAPAKSMCMQPCMCAFGDWDMLLV